jgi:bifunctional non-homologous end joining protein LigD
VIPKGQYGGGAVIVWDRGTWAPRDEPRAALARGRLTFTLHGDKVRGQWTLLRTRTGDRGEAWMLFKRNDAEADPARDVTRERPESVLTGRTVEQVAAAG